MAIFQAFAILLALSVVGVPVYFVFYGLVATWIANHQDKTLDQAMGEAWIPTLLIFLAVALFFGVVQYGIDSLDNLGGKRTPSPKVPELRREPVPEPPRTQAPQAAPDKETHAASPDSSVNSDFHL